jgi:hypothetical protein
MDFFAIDDDVLERGNAQSNLIEGVQWKIPGRAFPLI